MTRRHGVPRVGWEHLNAIARSVVRDDRLVALIRSYAWVEHALDATNVPGPRKPIASRILRTFRNSELSSGLDENSVRAAIAVRNRIGHDDAVPEPETCYEAVSTFRQVWHALSRTFVQLKTALDLGRAMLIRPGVKSVFLYGSMAREAQEPNDIDLLVLDDGSYSPEVFGEYGDGLFDAAKRTLEALVALELAEPRFRRASKCRWLDILIVDGDRFGEDLVYTMHVREAQPDPWFFINLARDIKQLDIVKDTFGTPVTSPFPELRRILSVLEAMGLA